MKKSIATGVVCLLTVPLLAQDQHFPAKVGVSIGTAVPQGRVHIGSAAIDNESSIRIGFIGDPGNKVVPLDAVTGGYNIDFHTWRDIVTDQIGARIRAERINRHQADNALVQGTSLAFHTSPGLVAANLTERMRIQDNGNVGIGTAIPAARLHVNSAASSIAQFTRLGVPGTDGMLHITNATSVAGHFIPAVRGKSYAPGRAFGMYVVGEVDDITPPTGEHAAAAVMIDGRTKSDTRLTLNNVLAVNSGNVNLMMVKADGSIGIGAVDTKGYKLAVNGSAVFTKVVVKAYNNWPDYVFADTYKLRPISELAQYVAEHRRLPEMPSAQDVADNGQDVGEVNRKLLEKVEELTLYIIQLNKRLDAQQQELSELKTGKQDVPRK